MVILMLCATVLSGCAIFKTRTEHQIYGNGDKVFYKAGEAVTIDPNANTTGLWVLTPNQMRYLVLDAVEGK